MIKRKKSRALIIEQKKVWVVQGKKGDTFVSFDGDEWWMASRAHYAWLHAWLPVVSQADQKMLWRLVDEIVSQKPSRTNTCL